MPLAVAYVELRGAPPEAQLVDLQRVVQRRLARQDEVPAYVLAQRCPGRLITIALRLGVVVVVAGDRDHRNARSLRGAKCGSLAATLLVLLAGCEMLGIPDPAKEAAAKEAEGKAIGSACRHALRAIEDCYTLNPKALKAALCVFSSTFGKFVGTPPLAKMWTSETIAKLKLLITNFYQDRQGVVERSLARAWT